jgi:hypothetical protein
MPKPEHIPGLGPIEAGIVSAKPDAPPSKSDEDKALLDALDKRLSIIRDRVTGVALGKRPSCFIWGTGGTGKSHEIRVVLQESKKPWNQLNTRVTAKGLFDQLRDAPDSVHLIEDAESLMAEKAASGLLRTAAWGPTPNGLHDRFITWATDAAKKFLFSGGLVIVSNQPLPKGADWKAFATRVGPLEYNPSSAEIAAKMRAIAKQGYSQGKARLSPEQCTEVAERIISLSRVLGKTLNIRMLVSTYQDRIMSDNGRTENSWEDLLKASLEERTIVRASPETREEAPDRKLNLVREILRLPVADQLPTWKEKTGESAATFYRMKGRAKAEESQTLN